MNKKELLVILVGMLISSLLTLIIHTTFVKREKSTLRPIDKFYMQEIQDLKKRDIELSTEFMILEKKSDQSDTVYRVIEKRVHDRGEKIKQLPDSLLDKQWKKFGY